MTPKTNKRFRLGIRVGMNFIYLLLTLAGTYGIVLLNPSLMAWYYMFGQFAVPGIALLIATVLAVLTVFTFRIIKEFSFFKPLLLATYPITLVIVTAIMYGGVENPVNLNDYFFHLANQKKTLEQVQGPYYETHPNATSPVQVSAGDPKETFFIEKDFQSEIDPKQTWVHLLKPSIINGADDYVALYDIENKKIYGLRSTDDIWKEVATKYKLNDMRMYEHVYFGDLEKDQLAMDVYRPVNGYYQMTLGFDGEHVIVKHVQFIDQHKHVTELGN